VLSFVIITLIEDRVVFYIEVHFIFAFSDDIALIRVSFSTSPLSIEYIYYPSFFQILLFSDDCSSVFYYTRTLRSPSFIDYP
jgi:hypothetical protein